jgi:diguanylate cyclase (GGDEF)-like protein
LAESSRHGQLLQSAFQARAAEAQIAAKQARYRALHDEPSRLPNAEYFRARLERALCRREPPYQDLAVLCIGLNLEEFQASIDACGREAVEKSRKSVAAGLVAASRAEDMLACLGGDTFACLAPGLSKRDQLSALAEKLLGSIPSPLRIGALQLCVRPCIGIAAHPCDGASAEVLVSNAKLAMQRARQRETGHLFADEV